MTRHPMTPRPRFRPLASVGLLLASGAMLAACASAPTRFFTVDPVAPSQPSASVHGGPAVKVLAVNIPPALDREELVSETAPGEVKVHDLEHWEAPLGLTARQALTQDLAARLPAGAVLGPATPGGGAVAALSVDIVSFRAGPDGAQMQASWSVALPGGMATPQVFRAPLVLLQAPGGGSGGEATAQAFSALLGELSDQIAVMLPVQVQALAATRPPQVQTQTRTTTQTSVVQHF